MSQILLYAFIYLFAAVAAVLISRRFGLGSVLGYLVAGIIIGPVLGLVGKELETIQQVAEFGVVMMLFLVGLELAPHKLWQLRHKLLGLGGLQVGLTAALIAAAAVLLGQSWQIGVAAGCILALSSTAIVLQTLGEKGLLSNQGGQSGFMVLLFQDVAAIPMLALLPLLGAAGAAARAEGVDHSINLLAGEPVWLQAIATALVLLTIVFGVRRIVPPMFHHIGRTHLREMFTIFTLMLVVGIAELMSVIGLSPALGTFIAGVALAESAYRHELESYLEPFKGLLLGLFFITVGAGINFRLLGAEFWPILGLTAGLIVLKMLVLYVLGRAFKLSGPANKLFVFSLAQAGEFGFVLLSISEQSHLLPPLIADRMLLVIALSMVATPLLFVMHDKLAARVKEEEAQERPHDDIAASKPIILLGHGRFGVQINSMLAACGFQSTVIDYHAETVEGLTKFGLKTYYGDANRPELLASAGLQDAKLLIVAIDDQHRALEIIQFVRRHYPKLPIIARAYDQRNGYELHRAGADHVIRETFDAAMRSARLALEALGIAPEKARELAELYTRRSDHRMHVLADMHDPDLPAYANEKLTVRLREMEAETAALMQQVLRASPSEAPAPPEPPEPPAPPAEADSIEDLPATDTASPPEPQNGLG
ncbi:potassium transporter [Allofranklinella schreckenbergeri]|uniref:Potassium transporter n=1 Tax=Allofranklinella schreckenbergeri TaxID=1076744 RepID=A0A3M6QL30_9BURK|nr:monovalent cation:proton antiporter-2 (CPA2) family protein [Allofranklinella schreckenbergeri]RMX03655.1 potassium transporter [Allofranklinella schreckenbergeri]